MAEGGGTVVITHRVRIFVFTGDPRGYRHFLVRPKPRAEWSWGPLSGPIRYEEQFHQAIQRQVREKLGLKEGAILDLAHHPTEMAGDITWVDWDFGFGIPFHGEVLPEPLPSPDEPDWTWATLGEALKLDLPRTVQEALIHLELLLHSPA